MNNYVGKLLKDNPYPGRGIVAGVSPEGKSVFAYFIMGRSSNSRNRVFVKSADGITIYPFDASKVEDPSLIIYSPVRRAGDRIVVTNGDQTDTVCEFLGKGKSFEEALKTRTFEPDRPNFTPRISLMIEPDGSYKMSILKCADGVGKASARFTFDYEPVAGNGRFIHTYIGDGNPIPSFYGEPEEVDIPSDIDEFTADVWNNLNADNKISLYTVYFDRATGTEEHRLINKYAK